MTVNSASTSSTHVRNGQTDPIRKIPKPSTKNFSSPSGDSKSAKSNCLPTKPALQNNLRSTKNGKSKLKPQTAQSGKNKPKPQTTQTGKSKPKPPKVLKIPAVTKPAVTKTERANKSEKISGGKNTEAKIDDSVISTLNEIRAAGGSKKFENLCVEHKRFIKEDLSSAIKNNFSDPGIDKQQREKSRENSKEGRKLKLKFDGMDEKYASREFKKIFKDFLPIKELEKIKSGSKYLSKFADVFIEEHTKQISVLLSDEKGSKLWKKDLGASFVTKENMKNNKLEHHDSIYRENILKMPRFESEKNIQEKMLLVYLFDFNIYLDTNEFNAEKSPTHRKNLLASDLKSIDSSTLFQRAEGDTKVVEYYNTIRLGN